MYQKCIHITLFNVKLSYWDLEVVKYIKCNVAAYTKNYGCLLHSQASSSGICPKTSWEHIRYAKEVFVYWSVSIAWNNRTPSNQRVFQCMAQAKHLNMLSWGHKTTRAKFKNTSNNWRPKKTNWNWQRKSNIFPLSWDSK